ncbi:MAG: protein kinase [Acidobacteriota bacterium]|nr:protein kinase [Blastocatellia bacterium]MDW8413572.1 protein kinase [Acidobacteriota bacterium]
MSLHDQDFTVGGCSNKRCLRPQPSETGRCKSCNVLLVGQLVRHRYEVKKTVGKGGFGITYLVADQDCFNELRILKELTPLQITYSDEEDSEIGKTAERLFRREAMVLLNLKHPGIPKLYAYFTEKEYQYLVQDFIPGQTLSEEAERRKTPYTEQEAYDILFEIADILEYLHSAQPPILHRDIKPQNLMRREDGRLLLIDFGAVCQAASGSHTSQTLIGSPGYAPVEQLLGTPLPQSDLYAAGATIIRLLTGMHPSQLFDNAKQRLVWESKAQVSPEFTKLLNELIQPDPNKRIPSATELKYRLKELKPKLAAEPVKLQQEIIQYSEAQVAPTRFFEELQAEPQFEEEVVTPDENKFAIPATAIPPTPTTPPDEIGNLAEQQIATLLASLYQRSFSGLLTCSKKDDLVNIYLEQGNLIAVERNLENDKIGSALLRHGLIGQQDLHKAIEQARARSISLSKAISEMGKVAADKLEEFIVDQALDSVYCVFEWTSGQYEIRNNLLPNEHATLRISTPNLIFNGLRKMSNIEHIKRALGNFSRKVVTTSDPNKLYQPLNLTPQEAFILSRIDAVMSIDDVLSLGGNTEQEVIKTVYGLLAVGILQWAENKETAKSPTVQKQPIPDIQRIQEAQAFCYEVENMMQLITSTNHYAVLGVGRFASSSEIENAYRQLSEKFHPSKDKYYNAGLRPQLEKIYQRVQTAYTVLINPQLRKDYDRVFRATGQIVVPFQLQQESEKNPRPPLRNEYPPPPPPPTKPVPVATDPRETAKKSSPTPSMFTTEPPPGKFVDLATAESWFQRGLKYYETGQFSQAAKAFQAAIHFAPKKDARYHFWLARSLSPVREYRQQAEEEFYIAIELDPRNPDYFAELGLFYQQLKMHRQAQEMFEKALTLAPDHPIAKQVKKTHDPS